MKPVLIIKLGDTMPDLAKHRGDFEDWFSQPLQVASLDTHVVDPRRGDMLPPPSEYAGILLTGSHSMVTNKDEWSLQTAAWLPGAVRAGVPLLGVCYGHQLLAAALGGTVGNHPRGIEMGTVEIMLKPAAKNDALLKMLPETVLTHASHSQSVLTLPPDAVLLASNDWDPHHAFAIGDYTWGIQFHPEFDAEIMAAYIKAFSEYLKAEGQDPDRLLKRVKETSHSRQVLERFAEIISERAENN